MNGETMEWFRVLPTVNASLNATAGVLVVLAFLAIRKKRVERHKRLMLSACPYRRCFW